MKKTYLFLFSIIISFFCISKVNALPALASCTYNANFAGVEIPIVFAIYPNGTLTVSPEDGNYYESSIGITYFIQYKNLNSYSQALYSQEKLASTCPRISVGRNSDNKVGIYYGVNSSSLEDLGYFEVLSLQGKMKIISPNVPVDTRKEKEYCTLSKKISNNSPINIRFYENIEGIKMFEVSSYDNKNIQSSAPFDGATSIKIGPNYYTITLDDDWNNISTYYSENCKTSKIYLALRNGDTSAFYITSKEVAPENNGSAIGKEDNGASYDNENEVNQKDDPSTKPLDYNLDLQQYCSDKQVSRTLKFIGILFYIAKIFVPALIIIMGSVDFAQAMLSGKSDEIPKRLPILIKRFVAGLIIFFIPTIIDFLFSSLEGYSEALKRSSNCRTCILNPGSCEIGD